MTSRTTRTTSRTIRTLPISSPPLGGLLICMVLMVLEVVLVVLEVVLVVLEVTGPQVPWGKFQIRLSLRPDLYSPATPVVFFRKLLIGGAGEYRPGLRDRRISYTPHGT